MSVAIRAVYENGVLRPTTPLALAEGSTVDVTIAPVPITAESEAHRRIRVATTLEAMWAAAAEANRLDPEPEFDVVEAMDRERRATGQRPLIPRPGDPE